MADDIASLGIEFDSSKVQTGIDRLNVLRSIAQRTGETVEQVRTRFEAATAATQKQGTATAAASAEMQRAVTANQAAARALQELQNQAAGLAGHLGTIGSSLARVNPVLLAVVATVGAAVFVFKQAATAALEFAQTAGRLEDLSDTVGFTTTQLQGLQQAGEDVNVSISQLETGLERFSAGFAQVRERTGDVYQALRQLDPAIARQISDAKSLSEAWDLVFKALGRASTEERNQALRGLFGRGGLPIGRVGAATNAAGGVDQFTAGLNQAEILSRNSIKAVNDLGDAIEKNMRLAKQNFEAAFAEPVLQAVESFTRNIRDLSLVVRDFDASKIVDFFGKLGILIPVIGPPLFVLINAIKLLKGVSDEAVAGTGAAGGDTFASRFDAANGSLKEFTRTTVDWRTQAIQAANESKTFMGALGGAATRAQQLRDQVLQLNAAVARNEISAKDAATAIGRLREGFAVERIQENVAALGEAATAAEKYAAQVADLTKKLHDGRISQDTFARAVRELDPTIKTLKQSFEDLTQGIVFGFLQGKSAAESLGNSLKAVTTQAASSTISNLIKGDFASAGTSALIAGVGFLGSKLFGGKSDAEKQADEQAAQAQAAILQTINQNLSAATVAGFNQSSKAGALGAFDAQAQAQFQEQFAEIKKGMVDTATANAAIAVLNSKLAAERLQIEQRFDEQMRQQVKSARDAFLGDDKSPIQRRLDELTTAAQSLSTALSELGESTAEVFGQVTAATDKLRSSFVDDLTRQLNAATGNSFINDIVDLIKAVQQNRQDAAALGLSTSLVEEVFQAKAQEIVDGAGLVGSAFDALIAQFPELSGVVHQTSGDLKEIVDTLNEAGKTIVDYVNSLLVGPTTPLSPSVRLAQAQATYNATLALAQANNIDALERITKDAENLRLAAEAFFGSGAGFQTIFQQIVGDLLSLPAVAGATDPVVVAINNAILAIQGTTSAVTGQTAEVIVGNNLQQSANTLQNAANALVISTNTLINTSNSLLDAISAFNQTQTQTMLAVQGGTDRLIEIKALLDEIRFQLSAGNLADIRLFTGQTAGALSVAHPWQSGGQVTGGVPGRDSVHSWLTPGEVVIREPIARNNPWLVPFNQTGHIPASNDNSDLASLLHAVLSELQRNTRVTAAGAERVAAPLDDLRLATREVARESKRMAA